MTATTTAAAAPVKVSTKAGYVASTRSEMIKFRGLRSAWILMGITAALLIGIGVLSAWSISYAASRDDSFDPTTASTSTVAGNGFLFAQLLIVSLAVIFVTGEWASGAVRTSVLSVDRRWQFLAGKITVLTLAAMAVTAVSGLITLLVAIPILSDHPFEPFGADARYHLATVCISAGMIALIGLGLGLLLRNSAGGIVVGIGLLIVLPLVLLIFGNWLELMRDVLDYLPMNLMSTFTTPQPGEESIGHLSAFLGALAWTLALLGLGALRLTRTDV